MAAEAPEHAAAPPVGVTGPLAQLLEFPWVRPGEPLARHTTMKVGGPAALFAEPQTPQELTALLERVHRLGVPLFVLGAGSNVVASEQGFDGVVLHLGKGFGSARFEGSRLVAGAAAYLPKLTHLALDHGLGNFEWACGVPGSAGGSLWGNAGARGFNGNSVESRDCAADFAGCVVAQRDGQIRELGSHDVEFGYRHSNLGDLIVLEVSFELRPLTPRQVPLHREAVRDLLKRRRDTQPANAASAGCIWKNPVSGPGAGALVEAAGLKGLLREGAAVSQLHGNFVINLGGASSDAVLNLIAHVEAEVLRNSGVQLQREARFL